MGCWVKVKGGRRVFVVGDLFFFFFLPGLWLGQNRCQRCGSVRRGGEAVAEGNIIMSFVQLLDRGSNSS